MKRAIDSILFHSVAAHLRGMRPASTSMKDTLTIRENSNTYTINQTLNYLPLDYF